MPLPENGTPWPQTDPHSQAVAEWSAWYSGDPTQLSGVYAGSGAVARPSQYAGGVVGKLARFFWGTPLAAGEQQTKLHVPLAADIAGTSADMLFSEPVKLAAGGKDKRLQEYLDGLQDTGLDATLHEAGEIAAALGGVYLRTVWDADVQDTPWLDAVHPDGAQPEWRYGRLRAVNFWTTYDGDAGRVYRLCERHEAGAIVYRLFEGTGTNLGHAVPLQELEQTADLAELVDQDGIQDTGTKRLTASYVPNMLPNRLDRHNPQGRADIQGLTPMLDALDEAYSSWWRDIRHGKSRIHMPRQYLDSDGPGQAGIADVDREVYVALDGVLGGSQQGLQIHAQQFAIRVQEHADTCKAWTDRIVQAAGYSTQTMSDGTGGAVTAAEVHAHERRSYMTRGKKVRYWTAGLQAALTTLVEVANANGLKGAPAGDVSASFQDGVQESAMSMAQTVQALRNAEAASVRTRVTMLHPEWDAKAVDAEVAAILAETGGAPQPIPEDAGL